MVTKEPTISCIQCKYILNILGITMEEYNRYKPMSFFTVYTSHIKDFTSKSINSKYIKVYRSKHTYERQHPNKQCQQLVLGTSQNPKTKYWACIDLSNGDQENTWYIWLFHSLKEANQHTKNQKLQPDYAELSLPIPVIAINVV